MDGVIVVSPCGLQMPILRPWGRSRLYAHFTPNKSIYQIFPTFISFEPNQSFLSKGNIGTYIHSELFVAICTQLWQFLLFKQ